MESINKEVKILPGITIKYGKGGISSSLHFNNQDDETNYKIRVERLKNTLSKQYDLAHEIKSEHTGKLTSKELQQFKDLLAQSNVDYTELSKNLENKQVEYNLVLENLSKAERSIIKFLLKKKRKRLAEQSEDLHLEVANLKELIPNSIISLEIDSEETYHELYEHVIEAFHLLQESKKKWDITSSKRTNMVAERTNAANTITRTNIDLMLQQLKLINNSTLPICFHNANGGDLFFYPGFLIVHENNRDFAIIDLTELDIYFRLQKFIEDEKVPSDTQVIDHTWYKVNKDGSPDKRFSNNYQIPIVLYGEIHFQSTTGLNEKYSFSNVETSELFAKAFNNYIDALKIAKKLVSEFD